MNRLSPYKPLREIIRIMPALLGIFFVTPDDSASAQTFWVGRGTGNWYVAANWSSGIPTAMTNAQINNAATATLVDPGARSNDFTLGNGPANSGTLEVLGGEARFASLQVGRQGTGMLAIAGGGSIASNRGDIGVFPDANGTATVDGAGSTWTNTDGLTVGVHGIGALSITRGGRVSNTAAVIGLDNAARGSATVDGPGSTWSNTGSLTIAYVRPGTLRISNGGWVWSSGAFIGREIFLGTPAKGDVFVEGTNSNWENAGSCRWESTQLDR